MSEKISATEESPGVVSMIRWALQFMLYVYGGVVAVITFVWAIKAFQGEPNWIFAGTLLGVVGGLKGMTEWAKVVQKGHEKEIEIQEGLNNLSKEMNEEI